MPEKWILQQYQALPLRAKITMTQARAREWYNHWDGDVYISFSGGKDSTALAHVVHEILPGVPLVFCNTGLEYPEVQEFARKMGAEFVRPKMLPLLLLRLRLQLPNMRKAMNAHSPRL